MSKPYKDKIISENKRIRLFEHATIDKNDLEWHRDKESRLVEVIEANGWKFQYDDELPVALNEGDQLFIPKEEFHRTIKGHGDLVIRITENPSPSSLDESLVDYFKSRKIKSIEDVRTYGDLKALIAAAKIKKQGGQAAEELKGAALKGAGKEVLKGLGKGFLADLFPGGGTLAALADIATKSNEVFDLAKAAYSLPDEATEGTALKHLNVDDEIAKIVDDPIENAFLKSYEKEIETFPNDTELASINITKELQKYIAKNFDERSVGEMELQEEFRTSELKSKLSSLGYKSATRLTDEETIILNNFVNKVISYLNSKDVKSVEDNSYLSKALNIIPATQEPDQEAVDQNPSQKAIQEAKGSTKGYIYEVMVRMVTDRNRNKSEIVNDLRSIKDVTVVSIVPGQDFKLQKGVAREKTLIKIKFTPGASPVKKMQQIKGAAFGRSSDGGCSHPKIQGLIELDFKRETLKPIRTY